MKIKKALLISTIGLYMSLALLIGTSYAGFKDNITSKNNTISSGTLDVMLTHDDNGVETEVTETTVLFDDIENGKWEPGAIALETITINNNGNLSTIYDLTLNIENADKNAEGKTLEEVLKIAYTEGVVTNKTDILALKYMDFKDFIIAGEFNSIQDEPRTYTLAIYWAPSDKDGWFVDGTDTSYGIDLGVTLFATQKSFENDSYGNNYDKEAGIIEVYTGQKFVLMLNIGRSVRLMDNITVDKGVLIKTGYDVLVDMNGKTITVNDASVEAAQKGWYVFDSQQGSKLTVDGNGKVEINSLSALLFRPWGDLVIENGTFIRNVPDGTPADKVNSLFAGTKVNPWGSQSVVINGGYFDSGYYDKNADDIDEILAGTKEFIETSQDIKYRGNNKDPNLLRVAVKNNVTKTLNLTYNLMKVYGGTFVGMNPAWGDEGCMLPTNPNYLRPWSYYQGALIEGQKFNKDGIVLPDGFTITKGQTEDGRPTYTVVYNGK